MDKTKIFIENAHKVHGDKYDYSKVEYVNNRTKVCIICRIHGEFWQTPYSHLSGKGCKECGYERSKLKQRKTTEKFINEIKELYGNKYDLSKVVYVNDKTKVCVICHEKDEFGEEHGEFWATPNNFLTKRECPKCKKRAKITKESFVKKGNLIHKNKYDYSKAEVKGVDDKICIICHEKDENGIEHGEFWQTPYKHLIGRGCPKCGNIKKGLSHRRNFDEIINEFNAIHHNKYNYGYSEYKGIDAKIKIICPTHGEFWQTPYSHLQGCGCPVCNESKLEKEIKYLLENNQIQYDYRIKRFKWLCGLELDFYLPQYNIAIECQGEQHFKPISFGSKAKHKEDFLEVIQERDERKRKLCEENGVKLLYYSNLRIEYPYEVFEDKEELLKEIKNT